MTRYIFILAITCLTAACSSSDIKSVQDYPGTQEEQRRERLGKLGGEDGLISFGKDKGQQNSPGANVGIGINSYLWRATLDTLSFMPLSSADPFGGVIITEWYENPDAKGERFKVNAVITSRNLTSDSVNVRVFKQSSNKNQQWTDASVKAEIAGDLEVKILTQARKLRIKDAK